MNTVDERHIILVCLFCVQNYGQDPGKESSGTLGRGLAHSGKISVRSSLSGLGKEKVMCYGRKRYQGNGNQNDGKQTKTQNKESKEIKI